MELFKWLMQKVDVEQDKYMIPYVGVDFNKVTGAMGFVLLMVLGGLGVFIVTGWHGSKVVQPVYFFAPKDGEVKRAVVIGSPSLSHAKVRRWAGNALREMYTFTFRDVDERMENSRRFFNHATATSFVSSSEGLITEVKQERLFSSLTLLEEPAIVQQMNVGGAMMWIIEVPAMLTVLGGEEPQYIEYMFQLTVRQVPVTDNPEGIVIVKKTFRG